MVQSLVNIAESHGAKFHFGEGVDHVSVDESKGKGGKADGIVLEGGRKVESDVVVVNADLAYAYGKLFRDQKGTPGSVRDPRKAKTLREKPHS